MAPQVGACRGSLGSGKFWLGWARLVKGNGSQQWEPFCFYGFVIAFFARLLGQPELITFGTKSLSVATSIDLSWIV